MNLWSLRRRACKVVMQSSGWFRYLRPEVAHLGAQPRQDTSRVAIYDQPAEDTPVEPT